MGEAQAQPNAPGADGAEPLRQAQQQAGQAGGHVLVQQFIQPQLKPLQPLVHELDAPQGQHRLASEQHVEGRARQCAKEGVRQRLGQDGALAAAATGDLPKNVPGLQDVEDDGTPRRRDAGELDPSFLEEIDGTIAPGGHRLARLYLVVPEQLLQLPQFRMVQVVEGAMRLRYQIRSGLDTKRPPMGGPGAVAGLPGLCSHQPDLADRRHLCLSDRSNHTLTVYAVSPQVAGVATSRMYTSPPAKPRTLLDKPMGFPPSAPVYRAGAAMPTIAPGRKSVCKLLHSGRWVPNVR